MTSQKPFTFNISLSVLNHLGRNLYRNFATILGEAVSNSWDADASNVYISIDRENETFSIKDDGVGMSNDDFQNKFLKIGYSKRKENGDKSSKERPFIGRKGIGKLALLSCAKKITIISKQKNGVFTGGLIDNRELDNAIKDDAATHDYPLGVISDNFLIEKNITFEHGTTLFFEGINEGIKNNIEYLRKIIALHFRFALVDPTFNIYLNNVLITTSDLKDLANKTQFCWQLNYLNDDFLELITASEGFKELKSLDFQRDVKGFIASVNKPRDTKVVGTNERATIDLFVNGRMREKDILKHAPSARLVENYLYGQIHFDELDMGIDRFTSSREGILSDDVTYSKFLENFRGKIIEEITKDWDVWRRKHRLDSDPDSESISKPLRKASELFNAVAEGYELPKSNTTSKIINPWIDSLVNEAQFNISSYAECFISENLVRNYIRHKNHPLSTEAKKTITKWQNTENDNKGLGNISIAIRKNQDDLSYLSMDDLSNLIDKVKDRIKDPGLSRDAAEYKPIRDALAHTALLTQEAKIRLTSVYANVKSRVQKLLLDA